MSILINRRQVMALGAATVSSLVARPGLSQVPESTLDYKPIIENNDAHVQSLMGQQNTDKASRWFGGIPHKGIYFCTSVGDLLEAGTASYLHPKSKLYHDKNLLQHLQWGATFLERTQSPEGNIDLPSTNFNSPPDTGFVVHSVGTAARLAQIHEVQELLDLFEPFLRKAGRGMALGGIHTPNHRWVVSSALAQINEVFPDALYTKRIEEWLAESIDIDDEGQYTERSTAGYNAVTNNALVTIAHKTKRPELLDHVRRNLDAMAYLLHANHEVVTEISHRQDLNTRRTMSSYWFSLRYLAVRDQNGLYAAMLAPHEPEQFRLPTLMEYAELGDALPAPMAIPDDYVLDLPRSGVTRIRRGNRSTTIMHKHNSRWITLRNGEAVINAVRFAGSFFGKGQFKPTRFEAREDGYYFRQEIRGQYYQPITDPKRLPVLQDEVGVKRGTRKTSEQCVIKYEGIVRETKTGFELTIHAHGTDDVPMAVEISLRPGGVLSGDGLESLGGDTHLLTSGYAQYQVGDDVIGFGAGNSEHSDIQLRGAEGKLSGTSVYLTGFTPFKQVININMP